MSDSVIARHRERADELAQKLTEAGLDVERKDYPPAAWDDHGSRHYIIVRDGNDTATGQVNDTLWDGNFAGHSNTPGGPALLQRVRAIVGQR